MLDRPAADTLADLRAEIDRIDARLHELLIERGEIIDRLIAVKAGASSAFRPHREAEMMRNLVSRHKGILPLDTVESIWRIIISTFTFVQTNYSVHADVSHGDAQMRDCCRFHFGFTVPYVTHQSIGAVIEAVAASKSDLGLVTVNCDATAGPWWKDLCPPAAPKIIARLPFVERIDHPAGHPLFVIAKPLTEAAAREVVLHSVTILRAPAPLDHDEFGSDRSNIMIETSDLSDVSRNMIESKGLERDFSENPASAFSHSVLSAALAARGIETIATAPDGAATALLLAAPGAVTETELRELIQKAGAEALSLIEIGSHAARFDLAKSEPSGPTK